MAIIRAIYFVETLLNVFISEMASLSNSIIGHDKEIL